MISGTSQTSFLNRLSDSSAVRDAAGKEVISLQQGAQEDEQRVPGISDRCRLSQRHHSAASLEEYRGCFELGAGNCIVVDQETLNRIDTLFSRISEDQAQILIDQRVIFNSDFLDFAGQLSDEDLENFVETATALQTSGNGIENQSFSASGKINKLVETLSQMESETVSRVLGKTSELSEAVPLSRQFLYMPGSLPLVPRGSEAANDLHNFVNIVTGLDEKEAGDLVNNLLDAMGTFSGGQERNLLKIVDSCQDVGLRLMEELSGFEQDVQNEAITWMADLVESIDPGASSHQIVAGGLCEWSGAGLNFDANARLVNHGMMNQYVSLLENYEFSDAQLEEMTSELSALDNFNQRAYLDITTIGLGNLLDGNPEEPTELEQNQTALNVIEQLRSDRTARQLVMESRMGEKKLMDGNEAAYAFAFKGDERARRDQVETIEALVTDAWFHRRDSDSMTDLASRIATLDAEQRDECVDDLHRLNRPDKPLISYGQEEREQEFGEFLTHTEVICQCNNPEDLLEACEKIGDDQQEEFWKAAHFLGTEANRFVDIIQESPLPEAKLLVTYMGNLLVQLDQEELPEEEALLQAALLQAYNALDAFAGMNTMRQEQGI